MSYQPTPPASFKCGHARSEENTRWNGTYACCRACYRVWLREYRQRTNRSEYERQRQQQQSPQQREVARLRRLRNILAQAATAKPHLYQQPTLLCMNK